jgi:monovalent cation/hydrogen antiporter
MPQYEVVIILLAACVGLGMLSQWLKLPYPILLVVGGLLFGIQSWTPDYEMDPDIVLYVFLPPLLYAGAFNTEWPAFRENLRSITLLAVGLVLFTTVAVAIVAHHVIGLSWPAAFILGAVVSPPDAVAAMSVLKVVRVPRVVSTILEGESLMNDATALVTLRIAVAAAAGGAFDLGEAALQFVAVSLGGLVLGLLGAWLVTRFHAWTSRHGLADAKLTIAVTLLTPYAVYLPAEHLHVSGVLAVVACGLFVGHRCEDVFPCDVYEEARAVWEMVEFLLNSMVFILIGMQFPLILTALQVDRHPLELCGMAAAVSVTVIVTRLLWMFPGAYGPRWFDRVVLGRPVQNPPWQSVAVVGWAGMRGVVSLAAAMGLPALRDGNPTWKAERGLVLFLTFWAIFATLVGQGLTLPLVVRWLGVDRLAASEPTPGEPAAPSES